MTDKTEIDSNLAKQLGQILAKQMMNDYVRFCEKNDIPVKRIGDVVMLDPKIYAQMPESEHTNAFGIDPTDEDPAGADDRIPHTPCLILTGGYEHGTSSRAGRVQFLEDPACSVQVAIPDSMPWPEAIENLKRLASGLEDLIQLRTQKPIGDLDLATDRPDLTF